MVISIFFSSCWDSPCTDWTILASLSHPTLQKRQHDFVNSLNMKEHKKQTCKVRRKDVGNVQAKLINFDIRPVEILKTSLPSLNIDLPHVWMGKKIILSSKEKNNTLLWQAIIRWALERISEKGEKWDFFQEPVPGRLIQWDWSKGDFFWDPFFFFPKSTWAWFCGKRSPKWLQKGKS